MPNWCDNTLIVTGSNDRVKQFMEETCHDDTPNRKELKFSAHFPEPNAEDWYDWRIKNWGTKWNGDIYDIKINEGELIVNFASAWSPPTHWLQKVARIFPDLHFELTYMETGIWFAGLCIAEGEDFEDLDREISQTDEEQREVTYDSKRERYVYVDDGEVIEDEDFTPNYSVI